MKLTSALSVSIVIAGLATASAQSPSGPRTGVDWPGFRGIAAAGVDDAQPLPTNWSVPDSKLVKWKVPVSGLGHSSPVVWGNLVCTASAISGEPDPQLKVGLYGDIASVLDATEHAGWSLCFDKRTGKQLWERTAQTRRAEGQAAYQVHPRQLDARDRRHATSSRFFGSEGLYAYDMNGKLIWKKDFGVLDSGFFMVPDAQWGFASSP